MGKQKKESRAARVSNPPALTLGQPLLPYRSGVAIPRASRAHLRRELEQRRPRRRPRRELQQLPVEREHEHWRLVRV